MTDWKLIEQWEKDVLDHAAFIKKQRKARRAEKRLLWWINLNRSLWSQIGLSFDSFLALLPPKARLEISELEKKYDHPKL